VVVRGRRCRHGFDGCLLRRTFDAFFAFIGFEDLANVVEEAKVPHRDIPRAMVLTLGISTVVYVLVAAIAVSAVSVERLSSSPAPLKSGVSPARWRQSGDDQRDCNRGDAEHLAQMTMAARVV
jgi:basic amino acid/polyamine antiporter, APA family